MGPAVLMGTAGGRNCTQQHGSEHWEKSATRTKRVSRWYPHPVMKGAFILYVPTSPRSLEATARHWPIANLTAPPPPHTHTSIPFPTLPSFPLPNPILHLGITCALGKLTYTNTNTFAEPSQALGTPVRAVVAPAVQSHAARLQDFVLGQDRVAQLASEAAGLAAVHDLHVTQVCDLVHLDKR